MPEKKKNKIYTNKFGPKGGKPTYSAKKRLSTGRMKYIYDKKGSGASGIASMGSAIPSALNRK
jgi:hypothetical protein